MFQIQIKKIDVIPSLLSISLHHKCCFSSAHCEWWVCPSRFFWSGAAQLVPVPVWQDQHTLQRITDTKQLKKFLPAQGSEGEGWNDEMPCLVVLLSPQHAGVGGKGKERSSVSHSWVFLPLCLCLAHPNLAQVGYSGLLVSTFMQKQLFLHHWWEQKTWPHIGHKAVTFLWAMGFSSDFRLFCIIQTGGNFWSFPGEAGGGIYCSHWKILCEVRAKEISSLENSVK